MFLILGSTTVDLLITGMEHLPVLGAVGNTPELDISERHLGLTTPAERRDTRGFLAGVAARLERSVDLDAIHTIARSAPQLPAVLPERPPALPGPRLRIGIARDEAFSFYYPDDLETFAAAGADLVPVDHRISDNVWLASRRLTRTALR